MSDKSAERVLVIPTRLFHEAGLFQGFSPRAAHYLPLLLDARHLLYLPRAEAEEDPSFKQIIPYVVLKCRDLVFNYVRGKSGGEARLRALRSLGVGGHICAEDAAATGEPYREALLRELNEEVYLESEYRERCVGLINDDGTPVGQVHLGVVHVFELAEPKARHREDALTRAGFDALDELRRCKGEFETWSQFLLDADVLAGTGSGTT